MSDECICKGNWRSIVNETQHLIDKRFRDRKGDEYTFFGIVHGSDDYYYGMFRRKDRKMILLSCVGSITEGHGYEPVRICHMEEEIKRLEVRRAGMEEEYDLLTKEYEVLSCEGESKDAKIDVLREALEEAMEWNWGDDDIPKRVVDQCEQALELVSEDKPLIDTVKDRINDPKTVDVNLEDL